MKWLDKKTLTVLIGLIVAIIILMTSNLIAFSAPEKSSSDGYTLQVDFKQIAFDRFIKIL